MCFFVVSREGAVLGCAACLFARRIYLHEGKQGWTIRSANRPQRAGGVVEREVQLPRHCELKPSTRKHRKKKSRGGKRK